MASTGARLPSFGHAVVRHNQSLSRNARGWSSGWNPLVGVAGAATRASAFSFIRMSAWMSIWIDRDRTRVRARGRSLPDRRHDGAGPSRRIVAKRMWRDPLRNEAWAGARRRQAVLAHQMFERSAAQALAPDRREHRPAGVRTVADPCREQLRRVAAERRAAFLPALAHTADMRAATEHHVVAPQVHQLGCPQAGLDREQEQRVITPSCPCRAIWRSQQRCDLFGAGEGRGRSARQTASQAHDRRH